MKIDDYDVDMDRAIEEAGDETSVLPALKYLQDNPDAWDTAQCAAKDVLVTLDPSTPGPAMVLMMARSNKTLCDMLIRCLAVSYQMGVMGIKGRLTEAILRNSTQPGAN